MGRYGRSSYSGDPRWLTAKFAGTCAGRDCSDEIKRGDEVFYYPNGKQAYVGACAESASRDFQSARFDEDVSA